MLEHKYNIIVMSNLINNTITNILSEVLYNSEIIMLINDGVAHVERINDELVIVHDVQGYKIYPSEIKDIKWINEDIRCTFQCNEGCVDLMLAKIYR